MSNPLPSDRELLAKPDLNPEHLEEAEVAARMAGMDAVEDFSSSERLPEGWPDLKRVRPDHQLDDHHPVAYDYYVLRPVA